MNNLLVFMNAYSHGKNGGDTVFIEIAKRIKYCQMTIVTSILGKILCEKNNLNADYIITTKESVFDNIIWIYIQRIILALRLDINIGSFNILLGTSDFLPDVLPIYFLKASNKKIKWVQHIFHLIPPTRIMPFIAQRISLFFIRKADSIVVDNRLLRNNLSSMGFDSKKITVNYLGVDTSRIRKIKKEKTGYECIYMGQLKSHKGIYDLIKIWNIIKKKCPQAKLGIIGKGNAAILNKTKSVVLLGFIPDNKVYSLISKSKLFLFPSREEGFGIAPLEAQAAGLPVVAWDLPVFREIFPRGMIRVAINEYNAFADEIIRLLSDKNHYIKTSKAAVSNSRRFSWDKTAEKEIRLLKKLK